MTLLNFKNKLIQFTIKKKANRRERKTKKEIKKKTFYTEISIMTPLILLKRYWLDESKNTKESQEWWPE